MKKYTCWYYYHKKVQYFLIDLSCFDKKIDNHLIDFLYIFSINFFSMKQTCDNNLYKYYLNNLY